MLDIKFIRENPELVQKATNEKNFPVDIKALLESDHQLRSARSRWEELQTQRNQISKTIGKAAPEDREALKKEVLDIKDKMTDLTQELRDREAEFHQFMLRVAQPARDDVPVGKDDQENVEIP